MIGMAAATLQLEAIGTRAPRLDEAAAVAELVSAVSSGWLGWSKTTAETILSWWTSPGLSLEDDVRIAVAEDEMVGYAFLLPSERWRSTFWLELWARTGYGEAEIATALVAALRPRTTVLARHVAPRATARLRIQVEEHRHGVRSALERCGFEIVRSPLRMVAGLDRALPAPSWPDGIRLRTFVPSDARALHDLEMEVLGDTWEFEPESFESWVAETEADNFDASLWWIAEHDGELVGTLTCRIDSSDPRLGWLHVLGVRRAWRGSWLWRALLLHALHEFRARGLERVGFGVDAENPTGACVLARRFGFQVAERYWTYEQRLRRPQPVRRLLRGARRAVAGDPNR
jgi:GNAT superfamily N-acetyltransferase